jgi:hypothetical protein
MYRSDSAADAALADSSLSAPAGVGEYSRPRAAGRRRARRSPLLGGGPAGNEQLTATLGVILIVLLAVLGITILRIGQMLSIHMFVGLLLLGPIAVKLGSTGYRFTRYYTHNRAYRRKGPPNPLMRGLAPFVVLTTLGVFGSGVALLLLGPAHRSGLAAIHKVTFILWLGVTALHVLGHLAELPSSLRATRSAQAAGLRRRGPADGAIGRGIVLAGGLVGGLVLAIAMVPQFSAWTSLFNFGH